MSTDQAGNFGEATNVRMNEVPARNINLQEEDKDDEQVST